MIIKFELACGTVNGQGPNLEIWVNNFIYKDFIANQTEIIAIDVLDTKDNYIIIKHKNKTDRDTIIINNEIVSDKFVSVNQIWVDDILIPESLFNGIVCPEYSLGYLESLKELPPTSYQDRSLYFNGSITYTFVKNYFAFLDNYHIVKDQEFISKNDNTTKYFGYDNLTDVEEQILTLLHKHGYSIIS